MKKQKFPLKTNTSLWLYGQHAVMAALNNPSRQKIKLKTVSALDKNLTKDAPVEMTTRADLDALLPEGAVHQGIALQTKPLAQPGIEEVLKDDGKREVILILDQVTDPHNIGAILRSSAAFDASAVILADAHAPEETGTLAKSACGALEVVPLIRVSNLARAMEYIKKAGFWIIGLDGKAKQTITKSSLPNKTAFVLGSEGEGLRRLTEEHCDYLVKLPISGKMESLNVSNAAAIALYEFNRSSGA